MIKMETFKPPVSVAKEGKRALKWLKERKEGRGFTKVGFTRAHQLAEQKPISFNTVKRMHSYLARHQVDKKAQGFYRGQYKFPSAGRVAYDAWGGESGKKWADKIVERG